MRRFYMKAGSKKHFESLIKDLREKGFFIVTFGKHICELENENEFVVIEW